MKVLVVLGISILSAVSEARRGHYCCGKGYQDDPEPEKDDTCVTFSGLVRNITHEGVKEHERTRHFDTEFEQEVELGITINAFSKAAAECIPNNRIYRNVHAILNDLNSIISDLTTSDSVMKKITKAQDYMDEHFDDLQAILNATHFNMPSHLSGHISDFLREQARNAADIFESNHKNSKAHRDVFKRTPILRLVHRLVERVDRCLGTRPDDFGRIFDCHQDVRSDAQKLKREMDKLPSGAMFILHTPDQSIDSLIFNFTAEVKDLERMITVEKSTQARKRRDDSRRRG